MRQKLAALFAPGGSRCWRLFLDRAGFVVFVARSCSCCCCVYVKMLPFYHPKQAVSVALAMIFVASSVLP